MNSFLTLFAFWCFLLISHTVNAQVLRRYPGMTASYNCFADDKASSDQYQLQIPLAMYSIVNGTRNLEDIAINDRNAIVLRDNRENSETRFEDLLRADDPAKIKTKKQTGKYGYHYEVLGEKLQSNLVVLSFFSTDIRKESSIEAYWINPLGLKINLRLHGCFEQ
jgi:hypothetical protein